MCCPESRCPLPRSRVVQPTAAAALAILVWGCAVAVPAQDERDPIEVWLECSEECDDELLAPVLAREDPRTILEGVLRDGPSAERRTDHRTALGRNWERIYGDPDIPPLEGVEQPSKDAYMDLFEGNLTHKYRVRAAEALLAIGDQRSVEAFDEVLGRHHLQPFLREDTKEALERLRSSLRDQ